MTTTLEISEEMRDLWPDPVRYATCTFPSCSCSGRCAQLLEEVPGG